MKIRVNTTKEDFCHEPNIPKIPRLSGGCLRTGSGESVKSAETARRGGKRLLRRQRHVGVFLGRHADHFRKRGRLDPELVSRKGINQKGGYRKRHHRCFGLLGFPALRKPDRGGNGGYGHGGRAELLRGMRAASIRAAFGEPHRDTPAVLSQLRVAAGSPDSPDRAIHRIGGLLRLPFSLVRQISFRSGNHRLESFLRHKPHFCHV